MAEQLLLDCIKALKDLAADWSGRNDALTRLQARLKEEPGLAHKMLVSTHFRQFVGVLNLQLAERRSIFLVNLCNVITQLAELLKNDFEPYFETLLPGLFKLLVVTIKIIAVSGGSCLSGCVSQIQLGIGSLTQLVRDGVQNAHQAVRGRAAELLQQVMEQQQRTGVPFTDAQLPLIEEAIKKSATDSDANARAAGRKIFTVYCSLHPTRAEAFFQAGDTVLHKKLAGILKLSEKKDAAPAAAVPASTSSVSVPPTPVVEKTVPIPHVPSTPATPAVAKVTTAKTPSIQATPSAPRTVPATPSAKPKPAVPSTPAPATPAVAKSTTAKTPNVQATPGSKLSLQQAFAQARLNGKENAGAPPATPSAPVRTAQPVAPVTPAPPAEPPKLVLPPADARLVLTLHPLSPAPVAAQDLPVTPEPEVVAEAAAEVAAPVAEAAAPQAVEDNNVVEVAAVAQPIPEAPVPAAPEPDTLIIHDTAIAVAPSPSQSIVLAAIEAVRAVPTPVFALELSSPDNDAFSPSSLKPDIALSVLLDSAGTNSIPSSPAAARVLVEPTQETLQALISEPAQDATPVVAHEVEQAPLQAEQLVIQEAPPTIEITPAEAAGIAKPDFVAEVAPEVTPAVVEAAQSDDVPIEAAIPQAEIKAEDVATEEPEFKSATPVKASRLTLSASCSPPTHCAPSSPVAEPPVQADSPMSSPEKLFPLASTVNATATVLADATPASVAIPLSLSPPSPLAEATFSVFAPQSHTTIIVEQSASATVNIAHICQASPAPSSNDESVMPRLAVSAVESTHFSPERTFHLSLSPISNAAPSSVAAAAPTPTVAPAAAPISAATPAGVKPAMEEVPTTAKKAVATFAPSPNAASPSVTAPAGTPRATPFKWAKKQAPIPQAKAATPLPGMTPWRGPASATAVASTPSVKSVVSVPPLVLPPVPVPATPSYAAAPAPPASAHKPVLKKSATKSAARGAKAAPKQAAKGKKAAPKAEPIATAVSPVSTPPAPPTVSAPPPATPIAVEAPRGSRRAKPVAPALQKKATAVAPAPVVVGTSVENSAEKPKSKAKAKKKAAAKKELKELFQEASGVAVASPEPAPSPAPVAAPVARPTARKGAAAKKATVVEKVTPAARTVLANIVPPPPAQTEEKNAAPASKKAPAKAKAKAKAKVSEEIKKEDIVVAALVAKGPAKPAAKRGSRGASNNNTVASEAPAVVEVPKLKAKAKAIVSDDKENKENAVDVPAPKTPVAKRLRKRAASRP